jgi:hypothetical protein
MSLHDTYLPHRDVLGLLPRLLPSHTHSTRYQPGIYRPDLPRAALHRPLARDNRKTSANVLTTNALAPMVSSNPRLAKIQPGNVVQHLQKPPMAAPSNVDIHRQRPTPVLPPLTNYTTCRRVNLMKQPPAAVHSGVGMPCNRTKSHPDHQVGLCCRST